MCPVPSPSELARALRALPPRPAALLERHCLEGRTSRELAVTYGVGTAAMEVHLARAAQALADALAGRASPEPDAGPPAPQGAAALAALERAGPDVVRALRALDAEAARSPQRRREDRLRTLLVLALAGLALWLGARQLAAPREPPAPPPAALP